MTAKYNITCVIGTRPEVLKMAPVISALQAIHQIHVQILVTAQHRSLLDQTLSLFDIKANIDFDVMTEDQQLGKLTATMLNKFEHYFNHHSCDLVIAQGDTTTTMVAALSSFYHKIPFAHIEAGLRTSQIYNPFPEEMNRRIVSQIAVLHFCPTDMAKNNLAQEGIKHGVYVTGNTIIDTLYRFVKQDESIKPQDKKIILTTCHRRENFGPSLENICNALKKIAQDNEDVKIIFPVHPNPNIKKTVYEKLDHVKGIELTEPLDYQALTSILSKCYLVLTDSGGLQEEAPALKKPVLVLRNETERPEGIICGAAKIAGTQTDHIISAVTELLNNPSVYEKMSQAGSPYGDGHAAKRIIDTVIQYLKG